MPDQTIVPQPDDSKALLTIPQASARYGISKDRLYELIAQRKFPAVILGPRCFRVHPPSVERWMEQQSMAHVSDRHQTGA